MESGSEFPIRARAEILKALIQALESPSNVMELAYESDDIDDFRERVSRMFNVDVHAARAIADMQVRSFFVQARRAIQAELAVIDRSLEGRTENSD